MRALTTTYISISAAIIVACGATNDVGEGASNSLGDTLADGLAGANLGDVASSSSDIAPGPWSEGVVLAEGYTEPGDPEQGRYVLLHGNYMSCGIPYTLWEDELSSGVVKGVLGVTDGEPTILGREGRNADLPYMLNAFTTEDGVDVVNANCLHCHASQFNGELVIGLGNAALDFTGMANDAAAFPITDEILTLFGLNEAEIAQFHKMVGRFSTVAPATVMRTIGNNPAEILAITLMRYHDRETLAWSDTPLVDGAIVDIDGNPIEDAVVTSDPPPWWRAHKKRAMFYNAMARGDHRGSMALATSVCVDTVEEAQRVDALFADIHAYVLSLRAPKYPFAIDAELAEQGRVVFEKTCAGCHGTYADNEAEETYPNLLIPLDAIGTDPVVANGGVIHSPNLVEWYNNSFYGQVTPFYPTDPDSGVVGYVAPPLDGVWATGPFLHNGSVPTIMQVLDSTQRAAVWRRTSYDTTMFDEENLGWPSMEMTIRQADAPESIRTTVYDTNYWSQSNTGHTYGDHLSGADRRAVLEYLKTI